MSQTVVVPGVGPLEFPDGMSEPDMAAAIQKNFPQIHQQSTGQQILTGAADVANAPAELARHAVTGAAAAPIAGLAGLLHLSGEGLAEAEDPAHAADVQNGPDAADTVRGVQNALTYQPRSATAQAIQAPVDKVMGVVPKVGNWVGEHATDAATAAGASPETAAAIGAGANTVTQAVPMVLGPKIGSAARSVGNAAMKLPPVQAVGDWVAPGSTANRLIRQYAGSPADQAQAAAAIDLHHAGDSGALAAKYGYQPTTAEVAQNTGLAQMERDLRNNNESAKPLANRTTENTNATKASLENISGTDMQREAVKNLRDTASRANYENAISNPTHDVPTTPAMSPATPGIDEAAAAAPPGATSVGMSPVGLRLQEVMQRPAMVDAMQAAKREAGNRGFKLDENNLIQNLHFAKMSLDGQISQAVRAGNNTTAAGLMDTKNTLLGVMNDLSPDYAAASAAHRALSAPLNRMEVGEALRQKYVPASGDVGGTSTTPAKFLDAYMRHGDQLAAGATDFSGARLNKMLTPSDLESLDAATQQIGRQNFAQNADRAVGSNTKQNLANAKAVENVGSLSSGMGPLGTIGMGLHHPAVAVADMLLGPRARTAVRSRLTQMALDPQAAADALRAARPSAQVPYAPAAAAIGATDASQQQPSGP